MSAQPSIPDPKDAAELFIADHQLAFSTALDNARQAKRTTDTPAWRMNYAEAMRSHKVEVCALAKNIQIEAEYALLNDTNETVEKAIKDCVKGMGEERASHAAWVGRAVAPYRTAAQNAAEIRDAIVTKAENAERDAPLVSHGLAFAVKALVDLWPRVSWDEKMGTVEIDDAPGVEA